jgi:hypothetical protein
MEASSLLPGQGEGGGAETEHTTTPSKQIPSLFSSSHLILLQLHLAAGFQFVRNISSSYIPFLCGLCNLTVPGTYFSVFKAKQNKLHPNILLKIKTTKEKEETPTEYDKMCSSL